jgi:hypothetical protein
VELPRFRTPLARALAPVAAGIVFFAVLFLATWAVAVLISRNADSVSGGFAPTIFEVGPVEAIAESVADDGPILFPDLKSADGTRSIVVDHAGDDPARGWQVYYGHPADRDPSCLVSHTPGTRIFVDCDGRELSPEELALPRAVRPIVENETTLYIDLRGVTSPLSVP